jgi:transcriptional regulator with XRE-family HTH domain
MAFLVSLGLLTRPAAVPEGRVASTAVRSAAAERVTNLQHSVMTMGRCGKIIAMAGNSGNNPATHFGKQMKKERLARGLGLREFAQLTGINAGHLSRIENGNRPPTETVATACDAAFPNRQGWFTEYYEELRGWSEVPAAFRNWAEFEEKANRLCDWWPSILTGLLQTEDYARALISVVPGTTPEAAAARLANRVERQRRVLGRDTPPKVVFLVDELALYRCVGSTEVMAAQVRRLCAVAVMPLITLQVLPAITHNANASGFIVVDDAAAYAEHVAGGYVFTDEQTVGSLALRFDSLRGECLKVSESAALLERMAEQWATGVSPLTQTVMAARASRLPPVTV